MSCTFRRQYVAHRLQYRPFINPKRIEANDKKKNRPKDEHAHHPGIPSTLLNVIDLRPPVRGSASLDYRRHDADP